MANVYWKLLWSAVFHSLVGGCGWFDYTSLNLIEPFVKRFINDSLHHHYGYTSTDSSLAFCWSALTTVWLVGNVPASILLNYVCERFGRKNTVTVFKNIAHIISALVQYWGAKILSVELLFLGRFLAGFPSAMAFFVPVFISECSPTEWRGLVASIPGLGLQVWCVLAMALGLPYMFGTEDHWHLVLLFPAFPSLLHLLASPLFHESPKHLYITMNDEKAAKKAIEFYHGPDAEVALVISEFEQEKNLTEAHGAISYRDIWNIKQLFWPFLVCNVASCTIAFDGNLVVNQYSVESMVGVTPLLAKQYSVWLVHVPAVCVSTATLFLVERTGRRTLFLWGIALCAIAELCILLSGTMKENHTTVSAVLSVMGMVIVMVGDSLGPSIVRTFLPGELCPQVSRSLTTATQFALENACATAVTFYYPPANNWVGSWAILPLLLATIAIYVFLYKRMPESKNRTVAEVVNQWAVMDGEMQPLLDADHEWVYM